MEFKAWLEARIKVPGQQAFDFMGVHYLEQPTKFEFKGTATVIHWSTLDPTRMVMGDKPDFMDKQPIHEKVFAQSFESAEKRIKEGLDDGRIMTVKGRNNKARQLRVEVKLNGFLIQWENSSDLKTKNKIVAQKEIKDG